MTHRARGSPEARTQLYLLKKRRRRSRISESMQQNLTQALSKMSKISYKLNLPKNVVKTIT